MGEEGREMVAERIIATQAMPSCFCNRSLHLADAAACGHLTCVPLGCAHCRSDLLLSITMYQIFDTMLRGSCAIRHMSTSVLT